jgi:hypothetical protein
MFDAKRRRIRCIGHIINLSLQAFLLATSKEALIAALAAASAVPGAQMVENFSATLNAQAEASILPGQPARKGGKARAKKQQESSNDEEYSGWQGIPSLRKLHNIAVWLRNSDIHSNLWDDAVGIRLGIDNVTRWSSWYKVIDNALKRKARVTQFVTDHDTALGENILTGLDWELLTKTHAFLQPFASATLYAEGDTSSISQSLVLMDALLFHYENAKVSHAKVS